LWGWRRRLRRELLDDAEPFTSLEHAQAALERGRTSTTTTAPHQGLDGQATVSPAQRFTPTGQDERDLLPLWLPPTLASTTTDVTHEEPGRLCAT
jgi:hypothetical protein